MDYRVVYDVTRTAPDLWFSAIGVVFILAGAVMVYGVRRETTPRTKPSMMRWFPYVFLGFGLFWTTSVTSLIIGDWLASKRAMREGRTIVVEGVVADFVPMPPGGHASETFTVGERAYEYGGSATSGRYATPMVHGGLIREGQHVRIHDHHGAILRLEIAADEIPVSRTTAPNPNRMIGYAAVFVFAFWFPFVIFALSWMSGWRGLARRFAGARLDDADGYLMQSARLGRFGGYRNALNVRVGEAAFSMVPTLPFGFFHDVLVIPWSAVEHVTRAKRFLRDVTVVKLAAEARELEFDGAVGDALRASFERWRGRAR
jgi:hypothetical protein